MYLCPLLVITPDFALVALQKFTDNKEKDRLLTWWIQDDVYKKHIIIKPLQEER